MSYSSGPDNALPVLCSSSKASLLVVGVSIACVIDAEDVLARPGDVAASTHNRNVDIAKTFR